MVTSNLPNFGAMSDKLKCENKKKVETDPLSHIERNSKKRVLPCEHSKMS